MVMRVLVLSPYPNLLRGPIEALGDDFISHLPDMEVSDLPAHDWLISFGYRKIIPERSLHDRMINIHLSVLPFNRGADPNFWSWFDDTPKGVTIHRINKSLDSGAILAQSRLFDEDFRHPFTLRSSYDDLLIRASGLFHRNWSAIRGGYIGGRLVKDGYDPTAQVGSYHNSSDKEKFLPFLKLGWDTRIHDIKKLGRIYRGHYDRDSGAR